jgi:hypothetical protein
MTEPSLDNQPAGYEPPKVWRSKTAYGGTFASINRPESGARRSSSIHREHPMARRSRSCWRSCWRQGTPAPSTTPG